MPRSFPRSWLKLRPSWKAAAALALGVGGGALGAWQMHGSLQERMQQRLEHGAEFATQHLQQRLDAYDRLLRQLAERMQANVDEGQQVFAQNAHFLLSQGQWPGLQTLSLTRTLSGDAHPAFELSYVWPLLGNEAQATARVSPSGAAFQSLLAAWQARAMSVSAPFPLSQEPDGPQGVVLRAPLFEAADNAGGDGKPLLLGMVNASIQAPELMRGLMPASDYPYVAMRLLDRGLAAPLGVEQPVQTLFSGPLWNEAQADPQFVRLPPLEQQLRVHDRVWTLQFKPIPGSRTLAEQGLPWAVLALGALAGLALAAWQMGWWQSRTRWLRRIETSTQAMEESDARFHTLCERAALGVVEVDLVRRRVTKANRHYCQLTGYSPRELAQRDVLDLVMPEYRAHCARLIDEIDPKSLRNVGELCLRARDGAALWVEVNAFVSGAADARRLWVLVQDISGRKRLEQIERQNHQHLHDLMQRLPLGLVMEDLEGRFVYWNEEFLRLAGHARQPDSGNQQWWLRMYPDAAERERVALRWRTAQARVRMALNAEKAARAAAGDEGKADGGPFSDPAASMIEAQELLLTGADGQRRPVLLSGVVQADGCLMILQDQSQRKAAEQEVQRLAFYDMLTGLPNRRLMADRLQQALAASRMHQHFGGLLLLDVDNLKAFNETLGLELGDLLLQGLSQRIKTLLPPGATVARQGGDDFVVLLEDLGSDPVAAAARLAQEAGRWLAVLREPLEIDGAMCQITMSVGLSLFGGEEVTAEEVLRRAEMAMYQAKSQGRNTSCFFDPQLQSALQERRVLEQDMRAGLSAGQFELFYQPQVEAGQVIGAEALLRWKHPQQGYVSPEQFIALAEETGFILSLGDWVLQAACRQLAQWEGHPLCGALTLSVNVSARQLHQSGFVEQVLKALASHGANPRRLKLELTESMLLTDVDDTIAKMARLKSYGIGFSLDDFGTGYSSLAYLKRLPLDQLKIDRSFVRDVLTDPNDAAIARTIVALAKSLGLHVIAEGVETLEQCRFLEGVQCHAWQGYLMSRPLPVQAFEQLLAEGQVRQWTTA